MAHNLLRISLERTFHNYVKNCKNSCLKYSSVSKDLIFDYSSKYNEEEKTKIFKFLNESSPDDIFRLSMSQQRLKRLITRRKNKGDFNTFYDILNVDGLGVKVMEKMCESILKFDPLKEKDVQKPKKKSLRKLLEPLIPRKKLDSLQTATAVHIHANRIAWAEIEKNNFALTNWNFYDLGGKDSKRLLLSDIIQMVWDVSKMLPKSDLYVMEAPMAVLRSTGADANNPKSVHVNLQKAQLIAVLNTAINITRNMNRNMDDNGNEFDHKVIYIRPALPSRLFKTFIGNEKVSAVATVENIINNSNANKQNDFKNLEVPDDIKNNYYRENDVHKEILSQTLLIALAFFEVCVFENQRAIEKLTRSNC